MSWQQLFRCLGLPSGRSLRVHCPWHFKGYLAVVLVVAASWVLNYALDVSPAVEALQRQPCKNSDGIANDVQLGYHSKALLIFFMWFAVARTSLFMPCIASRVATVQSRTHGFCRTCCVHLILKDGPLYIFAIASMLFWFHLMPNTYCEDRHVLMYQTLRFHAMYSCLISVLCMFLAYWHNKLLIQSARPRLASRDRGAPPGTLEKLETRAYDEGLFGDDQGKSYPAECAICLGTWDEDDVIKVTPCGHAFHEECLGGWFRNARTCAMCRQDCTRTPAASGHSSGWQTSSLRPRAVDAPTDGAAAAVSPPGSATTSNENTPGSLAVVAETESVGEESDDLEAAADEEPAPQPLAAVWRQLVVADEGSMPQPIPAVQRQLAHNGGHEEGLHSVLISTSRQPAGGRQQPAGECLQL